MISYKAAIDLLGRHMGEKRLNLESLANRLRRAKTEVLLVEQETALVESEIIQIQATIALLEAQGDEP